MKFAALVVLSLVAFAAANLNAGEREEGDVLVVSKRIARPPRPGLPGIAIQGVGSPGRITLVRATNNPGSNATVRIVGGGPKERKVILLAVSPIGTPINVTVEVFAMLPNANGTAPPPPTNSTPVFLDF